MFNTQKYPPITLDEVFDTSPRVEPGRFIARELDAKAVIAAAQAVQAEQAAQAAQAAQAERDYAEMSHEFAELIDWLDLMILLGV